MKKLIRKIFQHEVMDGDGVCPVYLERWTLAKLLGCAIYLHHFLGNDWAIDPHDHPRRFISIGLKGRYIEHIKEIRWDMSEINRATIYKAPWIRTFPAEHQHRIEMVEKGETAWTLVIVLWKSREWGFILNGKWIQWRKYVDIFGKSRKSC